MGLTLVTPAPVPALGLQQVRDWCRWTAADEPEDAILSALIGGAEEWCQNFTHRALLTQTWDWTLDAFAFELQVPKPPLQSIVQISYVDTDGVTQVLSSSLYQVDIGGVRGRLRPAWGEIWPSTRAQMNAVTIRFTAGYGDGVGDVPESLQNAMCVVVHDAFEHRGAVVTGAPVAQVPRTAELIAGPYRVPGF